MAEEQCNSSDALRARLVDTVDDALKRAENEVFTDIVYRVLDADDAESVTLETLAELQKCRNDVKREFLAVQERVFVLETLATEAALQQHAAPEMLLEARSMMREAKDAAAKRRAEVHALEAQFQQQTAALAATLGLFKDATQDARDAWEAAEADGARLDVSAVLARHDSKGSFGTLPSEAPLALASAADCDTVSAAQAARLSALSALSSAVRADLAGIAARMDALDAQLAGLSARKAKLAADAEMRPQAQALEDERAALLAAADALSALTGLHVSTAEAHARNTLTVTMPAVPLPGAEGRHTLPATLTVLLAPTPGAGGDRFSLASARLSVKRGGVAVPVCIAAAVAHAVETQDLAFLVREAQDAAHEAV